MAENRVETMLSGIDLTPGHFVKNACFECPGHVVYLRQGGSGHSGIFLCKY